MRAARAAAILRRPLCVAGDYLAVPAPHERERNFHPPAHPRPHGAVRTPLLFDPRFAEQVDRDQAQATAGDGGGDDPLKQLKADTAAAKGKTALVETMMAGFGARMSGALQRDRKQTRMGFGPPDVLRTMRGDVFEHVALACGVPSALLDKRAEGTAQREALRRFLHVGLEPLGEIVAAELARKLDMPGLRLDFSPLMASDLAGKARAIKGMVEAGIDLSQAVMIAGLD